MNISLIIQTVTVVCSKVSELSGWLNSCSVGKSLREVLVEGLMPVKHTCEKACMENKALVAQEDFVSGSLMIGSNSDRYKLIASLIF